MTFEQAIQELEQIVAKLESGNIDLELAIDYYTRGSKLKEHCQQKLNEAQLKVDQIIYKDGEVKDIQQSELKAFYEKE